MLGIIAMLVVHGELSIARSSKHFGGIWRRAAAAAAGPVSFGLGSWICGRVQINFSAGRARAGLRAPASRDAQEEASYAEWESSNSAETEEQKPKHIASCAPLAGRAAHRLHRYTERSMLGGDLRPLGRVFQIHGLPSWLGSMLVVRLDQHEGAWPPELTTTIRTMTV